jgi:cell division protein FtsL
MSKVTLLTIIVVFIVLLIAIIHFYDRYLVKEIDLYEKRLVKKGIFKRHFIKNKENQK